MDLHTCVIVLRNHKVITSKSVEHSIGIIERDSDNEISEIQINATDGGKFALITTIVWKTRLKA